MALWPVESLCLSETLAYTKDFNLHKSKDSFKTTDARDVSVDIFQ